MKETATNYRREEKLNAISHAIGAVLGIIGMFFLLAKNTNKTSYATISIVIYSISLVVLFSASTVFHSVSRVHLRKGFRIVDHISIFILIAGTYTPLVLISLVEENGWSMFYTVWGIAAVGTVLKLFFTGKYEIISLVLYVVMGWLIAFDYENLMQQTSTLGIRLLFLGSAFYCVGIVFYAIEKIRYNHFIWHLFVLGGAISHWLFIYLDVI
tara:strand:+ start:358 stop:993 length:636 start_codon:yes stop_codon:yes gene_type:complete